MLKLLNHILKLFFITWWAGLLIIKDYEIFNFIFLVISAITLTYVSLPISLKIKP